MAIEVQGTPDRSDGDGNTRRAGSEADEAAALLLAAIGAVSDHGGRDIAGRETPLFFPNGIDLISLEFKIGTSVNIALKVSGAACCKGTAAAPSTSEAGLSAYLASGLESTAFAAGSGSISERVNDAVSAQLRAENKWPPEDLTAVMETDYNYGRLSMRSFLGAVRQTLSEGSDPLHFSYDNAFVVSALPMAVAELMVAIEERTS